MQTEMVRVEAVPMAPARSPRRRAAEGPYPKARGPRRGPPRSPTGRYRRVFEDDTMNISRPPPAPVTPDPYYTACCQLHVVLRTLTAAGEERWMVDREQRALDEKAFVTAMDLQAMLLDASLMYQRNLLRTRLDAAAPAPTSAK